MQKTDISLIRAMKLSLNFKRKEGKEGNKNNDLKVVSVWRDENANIKVKCKARDGGIYVDTIHRLDDIDTQMLIKMIDCLEASG